MRRTPARPVWSWGFSCYASAAMTHTITVRLTEELERWLDKLSRETGIPKGQIIREQLEKARAETKGRKFMRLAGTVEGPADLSSRRGYARR